MSVRYHPIGSVTSDFPMLDRRDRGTKYENTFVSEIHHKESIELHRTVVRRKISSGRNIVAYECRIKEIIAVGLVYLSNTYCDARVIAGDSINLSNSFAKSLKADNIVLLKSTASEVSGAISVTVLACSKLGLIRTGKFAYLNECPDVHSVFAEEGVDLYKTKVNGNVFSKGGAKIKDSTIRQVLECRSTHLVIENSSIGTIKLMRPSEPFAGREEVKQIVELRNSQVGEIVFESGEGKIIRIDEGSLL